METRRETLSSSKLCRFCLTQSDSLASLYEKRATKNTVSLPLKILSCVSVEVFPSDKMPTYICNRCKFFVEISYDFKHLCRQADEHILQYIQNATPLPSVTWPQSLLKLFRVANKAPEIPLMKTIIEGGTTVHVTAQESDTDEEDDENVYNVKIGDGSDDGSKSARVKVITATGKQDKGKAKRGKDPEATDKTQLDVKQLLDSENQEKWPCDQCECAYPVKQLLNMHRLQKHGKQNLESGPVETNNSNTSDDEELKFKCVACGRKFIRLKLLKKHEKTVHADLVQQPCPKCPATFLSLNELKAHQKKHSKPANKPFFCKICKKRFVDKRMLQQHLEKVHKQKAPHTSKFSSSRFTSAKLSRHVRAHAEGKYPCKFCNKSFVKSHHLTRHHRLKHRENIRTCRGPFGESDQYRCEQCEDSFATQDELIYHSAIHATQNLICPLCQEKFEDVDAVTAHIKSHVNGTEFMCELCELVFTSKEKLDIHINIAHDDEIRSVPDLEDESSMEMDADEEDEDAGIHVKELDDHMVVEIKKANEFLLSSTQDESEVKLENTNSEESESETTLPDLMAVDTMAITNKISGKVALEKMPVGGTPIAKHPTTPPKKISKVDGQTASILRKAEEVKKKVIHQPTMELGTEKKDRNEKTNSNSGGANDKSLRLLEKELQELKRTNTRSEATKVPVKESLRNRRAQIHTSTPKSRTPAEEKKTQAAVKSPAIEKKLPERRVVTKENKEPKDSKDTKTNNVSAKEDKEKDIKEKEVKDKEAKEKETPKSIVKNGGERSIPEEGIRRSTRPSKIKDYAKMIRDRSQDSDDNYDTDDTDDEEYKETDKSIEIKPRARRTSVKTPAPKAPASTTVTPTPRKRGRPRKDAAVAPKVRKEEVDNEEETITENEIDKAKSAAVAEKEQDNKDASETVEENKSIAEQKPATLVSPTGQTLKKIPIKSLPPGIKPLPLPVNARPMGGGEVCEMQIGKKVVKVQKIVMTKAEVEAMAKKGLVEMKDGTMVLKQGIKIPTVDSTSLKSSLVGEDANKESPSKKDKAAPTRCDFGEDM